MPINPQKLITNFWDSRALTQGLRFLEKPAVKYTALSLVTMGIPRTYVDFTRNDAIGWETARYEAAGTAINYLLPGFLAYGIAKGTEVLTGPNGVKTTMWADNRSIDALYANWKKTGDTKNFIRKTLSQIEGDIGREFIEEQTENLHKLLNNSGKRTKEVKNALESIKTNIANQLGVRDNIKLSASGISTSVDKVVDNIYDMAGKIFKGSDDFIEKSVKKLKLTNNIKTVGALALAGTMTFGLQFVNRFITKKETGIEGYVGYSDMREEINKKWHKNDNKTQPSFTGYGTGFGFDGFYPNYNQIACYMAPLSFLGSLSAVRDQNEFTEKFLRGSAALVNIFFIPGIAGKIAALATEAKDHILEKPGNLKTIFGNKLKSYKEIEAYAFKNKLPLDKLIRAKNITKFAELAYAVLAVGVAVPWVTKVIVDKKHEKEVLEHQHLLDSLKVKNFGIIENISKNPGANDPYSKFIKKHIK